MTGKQKLIAWLAGGTVAVAGALQHPAVNGEQAAQRAVDMALEQEALVTEAYPDPGDPHILTACVGETHFVVKPGDILPGAKFTREQCVTRLYESLWAHAEPVIKCVGNAPMTLGQKLAFLDFNYNTGHFCGSSLAARARMADLKGSCNAILLYRYTAGQDCSQPSNRSCRGVWKRRLLQHRTCLDVQPT